MKYITRHDPDNELYEVTTQSGRKVIVTQYDSMLIWDPVKEEFLRKPTTEIKIGEFTAVTSKFPKTPITVTTVVMTDVCNADSDEIPLNREFGTFVGLYLAEGCCDTKTGKISITNVDSNLKQIVKTWFTKYGITHWEEEGHIGSTSTILAKFFDRWIGNSAENKYVPDEAFAAPDDFVIGLLNGYFAGNGRVTNKSEKLTMGIAHLCNRFGSFAKLKIGYELDIPSCFAERIRNKLDFIIDDNCTKDQCNYQEINDVVMDSVVSIHHVDVSQHPKVYDVTVPGTYHFTLFNGLNVYDTSDTGYIQRRLVKAMEDCKVYYDQTVRNATGTIVQFLYGEDGMEGNKMEKQFIPTIDMDFMTLDTEYYLRPDDILPIFMTQGAFEETQKDMKWHDRAKNHYHDLLADREFLITKVFHGNKESTLNYPIAFDRIFKDAIQRAQHAGLHPLPTDLTPTYVLDTLDALLEELKIHDTKQGTRFLHTLIRIHLSPKKLIIKQQVSRAIFDMVVQKIRMAFYKSIVHPGEMVGIVAAQTIGENSTQLVLDSFHSSGTAAAVKATSGVPRFKELLSVSKNIKTPILTIYLQEDIGTVYNPNEDDGNVNDPHVQEAKERAMRVMHSLEITRLVDILDGTEIYWDPSGLEDDQGMLEVYQAFQRANAGECVRKSPWVLRLKLNREKMYRLQLTMLDIYIRIKGAYPMVDCAFSDDNAKELTFRIQLQMADKSTDTEDVVATLRALEHNLMHNLLLKGLKGIKKVSMHLKNMTAYLRDDGTEGYKFTKSAQEEYEVEKMRFVKKAEWVLDTDGTNLKEILANPNVDATRTHSNDIWEIYYTLGVEAARTALYREIIDVGDGLNYRHVSLLLDTMSNRGTFMSVDRHGINRGDVGPLAKSSFEETTDILIKASAFSEYDHINGVSANIMLGQLPPCGTGDSEILFDEDRFRDLYKNIGNVTKEVEGEFVAQMELMDSCADSAIAFEYKLPTKTTGRMMPLTQLTFT
jgi:hypothetical protein